MPNYDELRNLDDHITRQPPDHEPDEIPEPETKYYDDYVGTITGIAGSWMSGLGSMWINHHQIYFENGPTIRALDACFGGVINVPKDPDEYDHTFDPASVIGKRIVFRLDMFNLLECFTPEEEWDGPEPTEY